MKRDKSRYWRITDFELDESIYTLKKWNAKYICIGREICPKTNRKHIHVALHLVNETSFNSMQKKIRTQKCSNE